MCIACINVCAWFPQMQEEDVGSSEAGVTEGCSSGYWKLNLGPLKEYSLLLTIDHLSSTYILFVYWSLLLSPMSFIVRNIPVYSRIL